LGKKFPKFLRFPMK